MPAHWKWIAPLVVAFASCSARDAAPDTSRALWVVTPRGIGPLHAGMTRAQAEAVVGGSLAVNHDSTWTNCAYTLTDRLPRGVRVMVEGGFVARVDVDSGANVATAEGARVGDPEERIKELYGARIETTPHKYIAGHYLTVSPATREDSEFRIVFETDGQRVLRFRAGRLPQVQYIEGCG